MSASVGSLRITKRAKCSRGNSPKGTSVLCGSAAPGAAAEFICASNSRSAASRPAASGASTVNCDCGVTARLELQAEIDQAILAPVHLAQVEIRRDQPDLIADPLGDQRGVGVVQHDALLAIEPARALVHLGNDG